MNPSYFRIKLPEKEAVKRLCKEMEGKPFIEKIETTSDKIVQVSLNDQGNWKGSVLYAYEKNGWTIFEDISGSYFSIPANTWLEFAHNEDLIVAGYNDADISGEFIEIKNGEIIKEYLEIMDYPEENVNNGSSEYDINNWTDIADYIDSDDLVFSETGTVYIF